jgi:outer membrane protein OmpA-like peptidoglycan-associated protein
MKTQKVIPTYIDRYTVRGALSVAALVWALALPAGAQTPAQAPTDSAPVAQTAPAAQQQPDINQQRLSNANKEGFWGHLNPFARKKWVKRQTDPINDRLTELDQLNSKNAADIKDVDSRSQAGIHQAQSTADAANQTAMAANTQAQGASTAAQGAASHVDQLNGTVNGLDQYKPVSETEVRFRSGAPVLSADAKARLDEVIQSLNGRKGYILDIEAHSPVRGSAGIQNSQKFAEAISRYLVAHDIPVYRLHSVALGNAQAQGSDEPVRISMVRVRLMENSLAAQDATPPQGSASSTGAERP